MATDRDISDLLAKIEKADIEIIPLEDLSRVSMESMIAREHPDDRQPSGGWIRFAPSRQQ